jgi:hypothetical protein
MTTRAARDVAMAGRLYFEAGWEPVAIAAQINRDPGWVAATVAALAAEPGGAEREARRRLSLRGPVRRHALRSQVQSLQRRIAVLQGEAARLAAACPERRA